MANFIVPKNVRSRFEFFPGFGIKELLLMVIGALVGVVIAIIIYYLNGKLLSFIVVPILTILGFAIGKTDARTGKNLIDLFNDFRNFKMRPKRYHFRYGEGRK